MLSQSYDCAWCRRYHGPPACARTAPGRPGLVGAGVGAGVGGGDGSGAAVGESVGVHLLLKQSSQYWPSGMYFEQHTLHTLQPPGASGLHWWHSSWTHFWHAGPFGMNSSQHAAHTVHLPSFGLQLCAHVGAEVGTEGAAVGADGAAVGANVGASG